MGRKLEKLEKLGNWKNWKNWKFLGGLWEESLSLSASHSASPPLSLSASRSASQPLAQPLSLSASLSASQPLSLAWLGQDGLPAGKRVPHFPGTRKTRSAFSWHPNNAFRIFGGPGKRVPRFVWYSKTRSAFLDHAKNHRKQYISLKGMENDSVAQKRSKSQPKGARGAPCAKTYSKPWCFCMVQKCGARC